MKDLRFTIKIDQEEGQRLGKVLLNLLLTQPGPKSNMNIVSHTANLKEVVNLCPKPESSAYVFRSSENKALVYIGTIPDDQWHFMLSKN